MESRGRGPVSRPTTPPTTKAPATRPTIFGEIMPVLIPPPPDPDEEKSVFPKLPGPHHKSPGGARASFPQWEAFPASHTPGSVGQDALPKLLRKKYAKVPLKHCHRDHFPLFSISWKQTRRCQSVAFPIWQLADWPRPYSHAPCLFRLPTPTSHIASPVLEPRSRLRNIAIPVSDPRFFTSGNVIPVLERRSPASRKPSPKLESHSGTRHIATPARVSQYLARNIATPLWETRYPTGNIPPPKRESRHHSGKHAPPTGEHTRLACCFRRPRRKPVP